jgi:TetR/AcrR family transcriptional regulator, transcriptional repressor for nem operon
MARPRSFDEQAVLKAATNSFWGQGFGATGLGALEDATGVSRSSLYLVFGSKRRLFEAVLAEYENSCVGPLLVPVEARGAGLQEAAGFFTALSTLFRDPASQRGCLMVNAIAELAGGNPGFTEVASRFADRYRSAFSNALGSAARLGNMHRRDAGRRAKLLAASAIGVWVVVRADPSAASAYCRAIAAEIRSWAGRDRSSEMLARPEDGATLPTR